MSRSLPQREGRAVVVVIEWDKCLVQCIPIGLDGRSVDAMTRRSVPTRQLACMEDWGIVVPLLGLVYGTGYSVRWLFLFLFSFGWGALSGRHTLQFQSPTSSSNHDPYPTERRDAELECSENSSQQKRSSEILYRQGESRTKKFFWSLLKRMMVWLENMH